MVKIKEKTNMLTTILIIGLVLVALILAYNTKTTAVVSGQDVRNLITVSGTSELTTMPNKAEIYVKIETFEKTAEEAKNANSKISKKVITALENKGVKNADIETSQFYLSPRYSWDEKTGKSEIDGYTLTNVLKVTTLDLDKVGNLVDTAVNSGANGIDNVIFGLTKDREKEIKSEALVRASEEAKVKAEALATRLGVNLKRIASISESSFSYIPYAYRFAAVEKVMAAEETQISPQKLEVSATVNLAYEIY